MRPPLLRSLFPFVLPALAALIAGLLPASSRLLSSAIFVFCLVFATGYTGPLLFRRAPRIVQWFAGATTLLAIQSIFQTVWYYLGGNLGMVADGSACAASILLIGCAILYAEYHSSESEEETLASTPEEPSSLIQGAWTTLVATSFGGATLFVLWNAWFVSTTQSVNSPWPLFPSGLFIAVSMMFAATILAALKGRLLLTSLCVGITLFSVAAITPLVYPLGYGFDGFLHRASEQVILQSGTLTPAPQAYIGQYTLVTWFERVLHVSHESADRWLLAVFVLLLPFASLHFLSGRRGKFAIAGILLALPLGLLAATTPQSVAYVLGLLALLWSIRDEEDRLATHPLIPWIFLLWSLATHPLAGLPFIFVLLGLQAIRMRRAIGIPLGILSWFAVVLAVPTAFFVRSLLQSQNAAFSLLTPTLLDSWNWLASRFVAPTTHLALWPDWANWQGYLSTLLLLSAGLFAAVQDRSRSRIWLSLIGFSLAANLSAWLLQISGDFSFLISYERQDYAGRLLTVAQLFLIPGALVGIAYWFDIAWKSHPRLRAAALLLGIAWFSVSVYNALPRNDAAAISHGWNVGQSDLEAVHFIDKQANGEAYTVLANQTVSAAAISAFGFKRYVGDVFYYPIPTGGPLYEQFLDMMTEPKRAIAEKAGALGKSPLVYVVVNRYWSHADQLVEQLKQISDRTWNVDRGTAYIFLFDVSTSSNATTTTSGS